MKVIISYIPVWYFNQTLQLEEILSFNLWNEDENP